MIQNALEPFLSCSATVVLILLYLRNRCVANIKAVLYYSELVSDMTCTDPPAVANAAKSGGGTAIGSVVRYTCNVGYTLLKGDAVRTCLETGQYTGISPFCGSKFSVYSINLRQSIWSSAQDCQKEFLDRHLKKNIKRIFILLKQFHKKEILRVRTQRHG